MKRSILVIAGETSGDMHAARIVNAIRKKDPDVDFWGIGGDDLEACGVRLEEHVRDMDAMGISEVLKKYFYFRRVFKRMLKLAQERKPDALLLVDYPGFNLRFAREAKGLGLKVIYYVCPQVWAWRSSRIKKMARIIDRLLVIFPFEKGLFADSGLQVDFVGHPLVETARELRAQEREQLPWKTEKRVAVLPGSRRQEIERIFPKMWKTAELMDRKESGLSFIIASPTKEVAAIVEEEMERLDGGPQNIALVIGQTRQVLLQARAAMVASGTATIESALMRSPMIIVYSVARFTYWLGRKLIRVPHIGMVNIVAKEELCPEFIQHEAIPARMAEAMERLVEDGPEREKMLAGLDEVAERLGVDDGIRRAADIVLQEVSE